MVPRRSVVALVFCFLLAGCAGVKEAAAPASTVDQARGAGAVEGQVTDDEFFPIEGALVHIFSKETAEAPPIILTTNSTGRFAARGLSPGLYNVFATKEGFEDPAPKSVSVVEGVTVTVTFEIARISLPVPYHVSKSHAANFFSDVCVFAPGVRQCTGAFQPTNLTILHKIDEAESGPLAALVVEVAWQPNIPTCSKGSQTHVFSPEQEGLDTTSPTSNSEHWIEENPYHWDNLPDRVEPPTHVFIPRDGPDLVAMHSESRSLLHDDVPIKIDGTWTIQTWPYTMGALGTPADVGCALNQRVDIWISSFYHEAPNPEWTVFE